MSRRQRRKQAATQPTRLRNTAKTLKRRGGVMLISGGIVLVAGLLLVAGVVLAPDKIKPKLDPVTEAHAGPPIPHPETAQMEAPVRRRIEEARRAVEAHPDSGDAWGGYGVLCDAHGIHDCAEVAYTRAAELAPQDFRWFYLLGFTAELRGAPVERVVRRYRTAAGLESRLPTIFYRLGEALTRAGRLDEAAEAYSQALAIDPDLAVAQRGLGQVALGQGKVEEAITHLERVVALGGGQNRATLNSLAQAQMRNGETEAAEATALLAAQVSGELPVPDPVRLRVQQLNLSSRECTRRALQAIQAGRYEAALEQMRLVEESRPEEPSTHYRIGLCLARLGRVEEALPRLERAAELAPDNEIVRAELERARGFLIRPR